MNEIKSKPYSQMTTLELTHQRQALETLDGGCTDWREWQALADAFKARGMIMNRDKCQGRADHYRQAQYEGQA